MPPTAKLNRRPAKGPGSARKRDRVRALIKRMHERSRRKRIAPSRHKRRRTAFALSASVMAMNTGMIDTAPPSQSVISTNAFDPWTTRMPASELSVSDDFKQALIEEEGVREVVYRDVAGYPTVGVGHLVTKADRLRVGQGVSYERILDFLEQDLAIAERAVERLVGNLPLYQHEFDALVDLVFNVGEGNVSDDKSPRLNAAIADGDYERIASELNYHHAGGKKARGLEFRSERRAQIFLDASYDDPRNEA
ncbi:lysozyme [Altererythrobacter arenosus]|uniref:Lysozyme n=1 Tax=Altererythrobacter arenosus TaxID=3032592 RepID=A0ABY8FRH0_9SPHN|nr:lysozyme [Altererythrobacter sp. CAU 1644]WFL76700.1 lysozyme [Altererythrobacter sp. CAU 1644]